MLNFRIKNEHFAGKTVQRIDASCVNVIKFYFTDKTAISIEVEWMGNGIYGITGSHEPAETIERADL